MIEWIEVPKRSGVAMAVKPDAVYAGVVRANLKRARGSAEMFYMKLAIGKAVAAKLGWEAGTPLRLRWGAGAPMLKIDAAPAKHPHVYPLKPAPGKGDHFTLSTTAFPANFIAPASQRAPVAFQALNDGQQARSLAELILTLPAAWFEPSSVVAAAKRRP